MTPRGQALVWVAQRGSAAVLAVCVLVHLATIVVAVQGGLTAAEILGRVRGNGPWLAFYALFVVAVAVHGPIGIRTILLEMTPLGERAAAGIALVLACFLLAMGLRAAWDLYGAA